MKIIGISGSPRKDGNTEYLLQKLVSSFNGEFIRLCKFKIGHCQSCWKCRKTENCILDDDMTKILIPKLLDADVMILGSPVYFNNVSSIMKAFIDRTWSIRGKLRNKLGASVVVGRHYGAESATVAIQSFFLKHEMIVANRGVSGIGYEKGDIAEDEEAQSATISLIERLKELGERLITDTQVE